MNREIRHEGYDENCTLYSVRNRITGYRATVGVTGVATFLAANPTTGEVVAAWTHGVPNPIALARITAS